MFTPMRSYENVLSITSEIYAGDPIILNRQIVEVAACEVHAISWLIPRDFNTPYDAHRVWGAPFPLGSIETNKTERTSVKNVAINRTVVTPTTREITPGFYIWAVKANYYCNIFNYIFGPYVNYAVPVYITILNPETRPPPKVTELLD